MSLDTLILNADAQPVSFVPLSTMSWKDAVKQMFQDRVSVIAEYDDWEVSSPSITIKVPAILMMHEYQNISKNVRYSSSMIKLRDEYKCQYCGDDCSHDHTLLTMDHVKPRKIGGKTSWDNIVAACFKCNNEKADTITSKPKIMPVKPSYFQLADKARKFPIQIGHESWLDYIGWDPNNVSIRSPHKRKI